MRMVRSDDSTEGIKISLTIHEIFLSRLTHPYAELFVELEKEVGKLESYYDVP
jgi:hypothetical protein